MSLEIYKLRCKLENVVNLRNKINDLQRKENNVTLKRYGEDE